MNKSARTHVRNMSPHELFTKDGTFMLSASSYDGLPLLDIPEIAFAGRSNVGKSSLINALTSRKNLARVSNTPGRTRQINLFNLSDHLILADLPGYGFAKVSKVMSIEWQQLIVAYLRNRKSLKLACLLMDARVMDNANDVAMMDLLDSAAMPFILVLTKLDKLNREEQAVALAAAKAAIANHASARDTIFATSSQKHYGISDLRSHLARVAQA